MTQDEKVTFYRLCPALEEIFSAPGQDHETIVASGHYLVDAKGRHAARIGVHYDHDVVGLCDGGEFLYKKYKKGEILRVIATGGCRWFRFVEDYTPPPGRLYSDPLNSFYAERQGFGYEDNPRDETVWDEGRIISPEPPTGPDCRE